MTTKEQQPEEHGYTMDGKGLYRDGELMTNDWMKEFDKQFNATYKKEQ